MVLGHHIILFLTKQGEHCLEGTSVPANLFPLTWFGAERKKPAQQVGDS